MRSHPLDALFARLLPLVQDNLPWWRNAVKRWARDPRHHVDGDGLESGVIPIPLPKVPLKPDERIALLAAIHDKYAAGVGQINPWSKIREKDSIQKQKLANRYGVLIGDRVPKLRKKWKACGAIVTSFTDEVEQELLNRMDFNRGDKQRVGAASEGVAAEPLTSNPLIVNVALGSKLRSKKMRRLRRKSGAALPSAAKVIRLEPNWPPHGWEILEEVPGDSSPSTILHWFDYTLDHLAISEHNARSGGKHEVIARTVGTPYVRDAYRLVRHLEKQGGSDALDEPPGEFSAHDAIRELGKVRRWAKSGSKPAGKYKANESVSFDSEQLAESVAAKVAEKLPNPRRAKKRGPKPRYVLKTTQRIVAAWKTGCYRSAKELAKELGITAKEVKKAIDRDRHCKPKAKSTAE